MNDINLANIYSRKEELYYFLACLILFGLSPLLSCGLIMLFVFYANEKDYAKPLLFLLPILILLVQFTRTFSMGEPSDWWSYSLSFHRASEMNIVEYLSITRGSEYGWALIKYVGNILTNDNWIVFASFIVMITFGIEGLAIYKFWQHTDTNVRYLVAALSMCFFFNEILGITNNLIRMQFAMSIITYVLVVRYTTNRILWLGIILALSIHSGIIMILPFLFIKSNKSLSLRNIVYITLAIVAISFVAIKLSGIFSNSSIYILKRIGFSITKNYNGVDVISPNVVFQLFIFVLLCYIKVILIDKSTGWLTQIYNFSGLFTIMCLLLLSMPLVVTRFYVARFFFFPLFLPYLFVKQDGIISSIYLFGIFTFYYIRFCHYQSVFLDIPGKIFSTDMLSILMSSPYI